MNKIKKYIGAALIAAMMAGSVNSQETVITDPKKSVSLFLSEVSKSNNINLNIASMDLYTI